MEIYRLPPKARVALAQSVRPYMWGAERDFASDGIRDICRRKTQSPDVKPRISVLINGTASDARSCFTIDGDCSECECRDECMEEYYNTLGI